MKRETNEKRRIGLGAYLLYTLNFTTFVSGPIQRYDEFARDQFADQPIALDRVWSACRLERIVRGFFKVNVLAMLLQNDAGRRARADVPAVALQLKLFAAFRLAVVYPFFLYANFSGYIDIVIALARLMRVRLPENFDRPFSASSFLDFWNRWHITLSTWLKTYVYNPLLLALMRRISSLALQPFLGVFCFFVTFFLIGVWHGRTSEFMSSVCCRAGELRSTNSGRCGLTARLGRKGYKALADNHIYIAFGRGLTFSWFAFTLFWFWANWKQIDSVFTAFSVAAMVWRLAGCLAVLRLWSWPLWEWLRAALLSIRTARAAGTHQPLCACGLCHCARPGCICHDRIAQPACSGYRLQSFLRRTYVSTIQAMKASSGLRLYHMGTSDFPPVAPSFNGSPAASGAAYRGSNP